MVMDFKTFESAIKTRIEIIGQETCPICKEPHNIIKRHQNDGSHAIVNRCLSCDNRELKAEQQKHYETWLERENERFFEKHSFIPDEIREQTLSSYKPATPSQTKAYEAVQEYITHFDTIRREQRNGFIFKGPFGTGKTHLAWCIAKELKDKGYRAAFISVPDVMDMIKSSYAKNAEMEENKLYNTLQKLDLLVLDEMGAEYVKRSFDNSMADTWVGDRLFKMINARSGKPTIYTTNLNSGQIKDKYGEMQGGRIASRMAGHCKYFMINGPDYRLQGW